MPTFRIFTNDRQTKRDGTLMYSCLMEIQAKDEAAAIAKINPAFGPPRHARIVALECPIESAGALGWLAKHVGEGR